MSWVRDPSPAPNPLSRSARHSACEAECRGFETRLPLEIPHYVWLRSASTSGRRTVRMRDRYDHQAIYPREVVRIARVERQPVRQRNRGDHRVVGPGVRLSARASKRRCDLTKCSSCLDVEGERIEVGFRLLKMCKAGGSFGLVRRYEGSDRQFREGDCGDEWLVGKGRGVPEAGQQDQS